MREIIHDYMEHYSGIPFFFISNLTLARAEQIAHFSVDAVNAETAAVHIQIFMMSGT